MISAYFNGKRIYYLFYPIPCVSWWLWFRKQGSALKNGSHFSLLFFLFFFFPLLYLFGFERGKKVVELGYFLNFFFVVPSHLLKFSNWLWYIVQKCQKELCYPHKYRAPGSGILTFGTLQIIDSMEPAMDWLGIERC